MSGRAENISDAISAVARRAVANGWTSYQTPTGHPADRPDLHSDPDDLVVAVGTGLRALHDLPLEDGSPIGWQTLFEQCKQAVELPSFDPAQLPPPYNRYDGRALLTMMTDGQPGTEERRVCHGYPELGQFMVDGGRFSGFTNLDTLTVADQHLDLSVVHRCVHHHLGPQAVFRFYDAYGADPDLIRLDHYILVSHILGR